MHTKYVPTRKVDPIQRIDLVSLYSNSSKSCHPRSKNLLSYTFRNRLFLIIKISFKNVHIDLQGEFLKPLGICYLLPIGHLRVSFA